MILSLIDNCKTFFDFGKISYFWDNLNLCIHIYVTVETFKKYLISNIFTNIHTELPKKDETLKTTRHLKYCDPKVFCLRVIWWLVKWFLKETNKFTDAENRECKEQNIKNSVQSSLKSPFVGNPVCCSRNLDFWRSSWDLKHFV